MNIIDNLPKRIAQPQPSPPIRPIQLPEGLLHSFNLVGSKSKILKQNVNSLPDISVDLLNTFKNPLNSIQHKNHTPWRNNYMVNQIAQINSQRSNKGRISFSYQNSVSNTIGQNYNQQRVILPRQASLDENKQSFFGGSFPAYSNLSEASRNKQIYHPTVTSSDLYKFQKPQQQVKVDKLGKKLKNAQVLKQNNFQPDQSSTPRLKLHQKEQGEICNSKRNFNNLSMDKSEYVYVNNTSEQEIKLVAEDYVYSSQNIYKQKSNHQQANSNKIPSHHSIYLPIQEQQYSYVERQRLTQFKDVQKGNKSPKKINNQVYIDGQLIIGQLTAIDQNNSRVSHNQDLNKLSKISKIQDNFHNQSHQNTQNQVFSLRNITIKQSHQFSPIKFANENQLEKQPRPTHPLEFIGRINELQLALKQKQEENRTLLSHIQNLKLQQNIDKEYDKLQMMSKLGQIQLKKLQNQLKMLMIKEKMHINKEKDYINQINSLKSQLKSAKNYLSTGNISKIFKRKQLPSQI